MLIASLGLHGLVLFLPYGDDPAQKQDKSPAQTEAKAVKITQLTNRKTTTLKPKTLPKLAAQPKLASTLKVAKPKPPVLVVKAPPPLPKVVPVPASPPVAPVASTKAVTVPPAPATKGDPNHEGSALDAETQTLVSRFEQLQGREVAGGADDLVSLFPEEHLGQFYTNPEQGIGQKGMMGVEYVSLQLPEAVLAQLQQLYPDYTLTPYADDYGGGPVYEVRQGNFVRYFNLVPAKMRAGTLLVLWNTPPA